MGTHQIPNSDVTPGGEESLGYEKIMSILHGLQPGEAGNAGQAFQDLAGKLDSVCEALQTTANQLAANGSWKGKAATAAIQQFQQLHDQTAQLAAQSRQSGNTLTWLGGDVMSPYSGIPSPQVASGLEQDISTAAQATTSAGAINELINGAPNGNAKANSAAQDYLRTFNQHLQTANNAMPKSLATPPGSEQGNPWAGSSGNHPRSSTSGGPSTGSGHMSVPGSSSPGSGGSVPSYSPSASGANPFSHSKLPSGGTSPSAGSLQGYTPPATGTGSPFGGGAGSTIGGGSANPFARMPVMPGGGYGSGSAAGEDVPGEGAAAGEDALKASKGSLPGEDETLPGEGGAAGEAGSAAEGAGGSGAGAAGEEAAGAAASEEGGASGMPMGAGGGGGSQDKERQRQAWMNEDQSIWGLPDEEIGSTIG